MIRLIHGDMLVELPKLEDKTIDLVLLDLPYGQTDCVWDKKIDLAILWRDLKRIAKPKTIFIFFCTTRFGYELIKSNEQWFRYDLVWDKVNSCGFLNARRQPMRRHEMMYVFYEKAGGVYNIADNHIHIPKLTKDYNSGGLYSDKKMIHAAGRQYSPCLPTSIITESTNKYRKSRNHPTEKPVPLYEFLIKYYTNKGDTVLDVCFGSGNSAIACDILGRSYIGFELNDKYFNALKARSPPI